MATSTVDGRIATHTAARQLGNIDRADALAARVGVVVLQSYRRLVAWLRTRPGIEDVHRRIDQEMARLTAELVTSMRAGLTREAELAWGSAIAMWTEALAPEQWSALLHERGRRMGELAERLDPPIGPIPSAAEIALLIRSGQIRVDPQPALSAAITVFPPPAVARVQAIVFQTYGREWQDGLSWDARISRLSRLAPPKLVADSLIDGIAAGENPRQLEKRLRPILNGNRASAMRVARTESIRVAETMQREQYMSVESVIGAQILSVLGETTRPEHAARHGTIYWKPGKGSPTTAEMPSLPDEPNCLCWSSPVFDEPEAAVTDAVSGPQFDPVSMQRVFDTWTDRQRRTLIGARRYKVVADKLAGVRRPQFADFIDPKTGRLLPTQHLRGEELWRLDQRAAVARDVISRRAADVATARSSAVAKRGAFIGPTPQQLDDLVLALKQQQDTAFAIVKPTTRAPTTATVRDPQASDPGPELRRRLLAAADEDQAAIEAAKARVSELGNFDIARIDAIVREKAVLAGVPPEQIRFTVEKSIMLEYRQAKATRDALLAARDARLAEILRVPTGAGPLPVKISGKRASAIRAGTDRFRSVLSRPGLSQRQVAATSKPGQRGDYSASAGRLRVGARSNPAWAERTAVHEWGHWLEDTADPAVSKAARDFLARRTVGEQAQQLSKLKPGHRYKSGEVAKPDRFIEPYMGKVYSHGSTELVSMGVEYYVYDPVTLATKDPEYFDWIVRILRGLEP